MKKMIKYGLSALFTTCLIALAGCSTEDITTDQFPADDVYLVSYGPLPVARGGELRFIGGNLQNVTEIAIPGVAPVTSIEVVKSGIPSEIRIIVPKDGSLPGVVTLKANGKELAAKTEISYTEPIELKSFAPEAVKPGDELTIEGDYLNLIHEVVFAEDVVVSESDFTAHSRYEIKVIVPVEARTGAIAIGDIDETDEANADIFPNRIVSEEVLTVAQPEAVKVEAPRFKGGETITITGANLQYTDYIKMQGADVTEFTVNAAGTTLSFVQPFEAQDGTIYLVAKSGVEVAAGELACVVPTELAAAPQPVKAGGKLTVTGKDLDLVTGVSLPNAEWLAFETGNGISFEVPDTAQEGDVSLFMANGAAVTVAYTLVKPEFAAYSANPAAAGSSITITGSNLDLVKSVTFGGDLKVEVEEPAADAITVSVPTTAQSGALLLNLANGTSIACAELTVNVPEACYITELPEEGTEIFGGTVLVVPVTNEDKLIGVQVNGAEVAYILSGTMLYISLPDNAASGTTLTLVSSNGTVEYTIDCIPNTIQKRVIWSGLWDCGSWSGNQDLAWGGFDWTTVEAGSKLLFEFTEDMSQGWWQLSLRHGDNWGDLPENTFFDLEAGQTSLEVEFTQAMLDDLIANNGLVITGCNYILTKITVITEISLETVVWTGAAETGDYANNLELGGEDDWVNAGLKEGAEIRIYFTAADPNDWSLQVFDGHWGGMGYVTPDGVQFNQDNSSDAIAKGYVSFKAEGAAYEALTSKQWWGSALIVQGKFLTVTKLAFM